MALSGRFCLFPGLTKSLMFWSNTTADFFRKKFSDLPVLQNRKLFEPTERFSKRNYMTAIQRINGLRSFQVCQFVRKTKSRKESPTSLIQNDEYWFCPTSIFSYRQWLKETQKMSSDAVELHHKAQRLFTGVLLLLLVDVIWVVSRHFNQSSSVF